MFNCEDFGSVGSIVEVFVQVNAAGEGAEFFLALLHTLFFFFFFLEANGYSITQTRGGLGSQTGIEQPIKYRDLWKERAFLANESAISFCVLGK